MTLTYANGLYDSDGDMYDDRLIIFINNIPQLAFSNYESFVRFIEDLEDIKKEAYKDQSRIDTSVMKNYNIFNWKGNGYMKFYRCGSGDANPTTDFNHNMII